MSNRFEDFILKNILWFQFALLLCLIIGSVITISQLKHEYQHHVNLGIQIEHNLEVQVQDMEALIAASKKGYRFTAGNSWQMAQLILHGKVDMGGFPDYDLKYPDSTWFHGWLNSHGLLVAEDRR